MTIYSIFPEERIPDSVSSGDAALYTLSFGFFAPEGSSILGGRVYLVADDPNTDVYHRRWSSFQLWKVTDQELVLDVTIDSLEEDGWVDLIFPEPYVVSSGDEEGFFLSVFTPSTTAGKEYTYEHAVFDGVDLQSGLPGFYAWADGSSPYLNNAFAVGGSPTFPTGSFAQPWYGLDVYVQDATPSNPEWFEWSGTTEQPITLDGVWDGSVISPVTLDAIT